MQLTVPIDKFVDGGALWLELETTTAGLTVEQVRWSVGRTRARRATAVVICTFNRADDCLATLQTLVSDPEVVGELAAVYVVDQGTDTVDSRDAFPALRDALGTTLRYIRQPNFGGAGGFTRGIYEAVRNETIDRVNLLLMDDDIRLEPDTVIRLRALADRADEPVIVGGQMLNLLHPRPAARRRRDHRPLHPAGRAPGRRRARRGRRHRGAAGDPGRRGLQRVVDLPHPLRGRRRPSATRCRCSSSGTTSSTGCAPRRPGSRP